MKLLFQIIGIIVFLSSSGCDFIYKKLDKEGAEEKELLGISLPFEKNPTVEEIQTLLKIYGYSSGKVDGVFGAKTRNAIKRFQQDNHLMVSSHADQETWKKLKVFVENGLISNDQLNIALIQECLVRSGFSPGLIDGKMGPRTRKAVVAFQGRHGLKPDSKIGYKTLTYLAEFLEEKSP